MRSPAMPLLIDEDVPQAVSEFLRERGHNVQMVRGSPLEREADAVLAKAVIEARGIVVTWNHRHFSQLIDRRPPLNYTRFPNVGRLSFVCPHAMGLKRLRELIEDIEREYQLVQERRDRRLIMVIGDTWFRIDR